MADRNEGNWIGKSSFAAESSADAAISDGLNSRILISEILQRNQNFKKWIKKIVRNRGKYRVITILSLEEHFVSAILKSLKVRGLIGHEEGQEVIDKAEGSDRSHSPL